jgi:hypothetical protein
MIIGTNRVLQRLPVQAGDILMDNSLGQYNEPVVMVKHLLDLFEQGQVETTPSAILEAQSLVELGPEGWMESYDYGDMIDFEACQAGLINEMIDHVLSRMLPDGLMIDETEECVLYVREID